MNLSEKSSGNTDYESTEREESMLQLTKTKINHFGLVLGTASIHTVNRILFIAPLYYRTTFFSYKISLIPPKIGPMLENVIGRTVY